VYTPAEVERAKAATTLAMTHASVAVSEHNAAAARAVALRKIASQARQRSNTAYTRQGGAALYCLWLLQEGIAKASKVRARARGILLCFRARPGYWS
jgi:hypothetical protein